MDPVEVGIAKAYINRKTADIPARVSSAIASENIPGKIADAVALDGTVISAAATAASAAIAGADLITGTDSRIPKAQPNDEVAFTIVGSDDRRSWVEIGPDGHPTANSAALIDAALATATTARIDTATAALPVPVPIEIGSGVSYAVVDSAGRGSWLQVGPDGRPTAASVAMLTDAGLGAATIPDGSLTEAKLVPGVAQRIPQSSSVVDALIPANRGLVVRDRTGNPRPMVSDASVIACWGDSLTEGWPHANVDPATQSWPAVLDSLYAGGTTYNGGYSGETADEIALRQGGLVMMVNVTGGSIPASGAVNVTMTQLLGWRLDRDWGSVPVTIAGVAGTLVHNSTSAIWTFTRTTPGSSVAVAGAAEVTSSPGAQYRGNVQVIFAGRNDIGYSSPAGDVGNRVVAAAVAMVGYLSPVHPRFLLVGTTTATGETRGSGAYNVVTGINQKLAALYPNNFYDLRSYLVNQCIYDQGITPDATDLAKMAADTLPPSIMVSGDAVHYSAGTSAKVGLQIYNQLNTRGWLL